MAKRLHAFQIDSVNVVVRAHYMPALARIGRYQMEGLDLLAYHKRELFEYWGHEASLMPVSLYPFVRYRMDKHTERTQEYIRSERGRYMASVYAEVAERGPITARELSGAGGARVTGKRRSNISMTPVSLLLPAVGSSSASTTFPNASYLRRLEMR